MRWLAFFLVLLSGVCSVHAQETYQTVNAKRKIVQADKNRNGIREKSEVRYAWMQVNVLDQDGDDALRYHSKHNKNHYNKSGSGINCLILFKQL